MADIRPSDRAIAKAFYELSDKAFQTKDDEWVFPVLRIITDRAAELDATAAPVVVGEVSGNGLKCEAGFVYDDGIHTPTVLISFQPDDWDARDKFMAGIKNAAAMAASMEVK